MTANVVEWVKRNRAMVVPVVLLGLLALFFGWRAAQLRDWVHIALAAGYGILTALALARRLGRGVRSNALNAGISLLFLDLVFAQLNLKDVGGALAEARWWLLLPSLAALMVHLVIRVWRWQWLLKPMGDVPFGPAFRAGMIGIGGNMVLPARAGEFLRAYVIGRSSGISKTGAFATLVVERIFDGLTMLLILVGLVLFGVRDVQLQRIGLLGAAFYMLALAGVVVFMSRRAWFDWLAHHL
ncbi:MAG: lysylphosphatidylglycerol synthase transmembrane domain-containing protein, partial [Anaerolineae bacterium]